jgi:DNA primase
MRYPPFLLDEIRARLPVSQVVGKRVQLRKAGREWKGLSPFNAEKSPSFTVNDQKGFYHCFSSGKHGDVFTFLMETEGLSFPDAIERLAADAGVALPKMEAEAQVHERKRQNLYEICELACAFFEQQLRGSLGRQARDYLDQRGLQLKARETFRMGFAPSERFVLRDYLASKQVPLDAMIEAGLIIAGPDINVPYDRFRDRIIFPIQDQKGRVIAFGGRAMAGDAKAKYLNSPETPLFHKGRRLYNISRARKAAHERGHVIVAEGYVDVIALSEAGFPHSVAPLGTALTEDQVKLLWRMADEPVLCFDGDKAGRRAAFRAIDVVLPLLEPGKTVRFALLPEGQDPDDVIRSGGMSAMESVLEAARPLFDMLWMRESESAPANTPERRAAFESRLRASIQTIKNEPVRRYYLEALLERLKPERTFYPRPFKGRGDQSHLGQRAPLRASPLLAGTALFSGAGSDSPREALIICALLVHGRLLETMAETLAELELTSRHAETLRRALLDVAAQGLSPDAETLQKLLEKRGLLNAALQLQNRVRPGDRWVLDPFADLLKLGEVLSQAMILHRKAHALHRELRLAQQAIAEEDREEHLVWLQTVQAEINSLEGSETELSSSP